jgi:transposase
MKKLLKIIEILKGNDYEVEIQKESSSDKSCENCEKLLRIIKELTEELTKAKKDFELEIKKANTKIEILEGTIKGLLAERFGQSSEKNKYLSSEEDKIDDSENNENSENEGNHEDEVGNRRKRGGQKGQKGHGRKLPNKIPQIIHNWKLSEDECKCPICGKRYRIIPKFQRTSNEIEIKIEIIMNVHKQEVYEKECNCDVNAPELIVAKKPVNIIYKSIFSTETWCKMLALKYLTGIPVNRFNLLFTDIGYEIAPSTVLGGFKKILKFTRPLYDEIVKYNQKESHWHCDETSWCRLFDNDSKTTRLYWVWVFVGKKSVVYVVDPTRSKNVPARHFENTKSGIVNVDRYASYNILSDKLILSYCWYHLRRDFINLFKKYKSLENWVFKWLKKISELEGLNKKRFELYYRNESYEEIQIDLEEKVKKFFAAASFELDNSTLKTGQSKVLKSMINKQSGYTVFLDFPEVPMDNTQAEREFRHVAFARNNYNGSKSQWGGELAAIMWTIFKSAQMNGLDPVLYLQQYLKEYAINNKVPKNLDNLLPWNFKNHVVTIQKDTG